MNYQEAAKLFSPIWADLRPENEYFNRKPLLAHYTTIQTFEQMLRNNQLWFSNPLFMNDLEEVRFGVGQGTRLVLTGQKIADACGTPQRAQTFRAAFESYYQQFENGSVRDTYVFCLSFHKREDNDGLLSMWRGYGANGNGVSIVFDTAQLSPPEGGPMIMAEVHYATVAARIEWLEAKLTTFANILSTSQIADSELYLAAFMLFERIKLFALFSKHSGFAEEQEWRVVYLPERDESKALFPMFGYSIGARGIEPRLKFKVLPLKDVSSEDLSFEKLIERIILGPTISSSLAVLAVHRMLDETGHSVLKPRLRASTIPFRAPV